jgi:hypothetical protein
MAKLIGQKPMNIVVSHLDEVRDAVHDEARVVEGRARGYLEEARGSTRWHKIYGPDHLTRVTLTQGDTDSFVNLEAPNPMAIEFGHEPSGVFGPGGELGHIKTRAPHGLYILTHATGFTDLSS